MNKTLAAAADGAASLLIASGLFVGESFVYKLADDRWPRSKRTADRVCGSVSPSAVVCRFGSTFGCKQPAPQQFELSYGSAPAWKNGHDRLVPTSADERAA
jgi:hypothetical protein